MEQFLSMFDSCGFKCLTKVNLLGSEFLNDYYDAEGPLKEYWRKGISMYGVASSEELRETESTLRDLKDKGKLEDFMMENDRTCDVGVFTLIVCVPV